MSLYSICKNLLSVTLVKLCRVTVINPENEPVDGALVCANHISNIDPIIICATLKNQIRFMAKKELFRIPLLGTMLKAFGAFPVNRGAVDMTAMKIALKHLENKSYVGMFPQGTRVSGKHPSESSVKSGVGMILSRVKTDVLPIAIITKNYKFKLGRKIYVVIGEPITADSINSTEKNRSEFDRLSKLVFDEILKLHVKYSYLIEDGEK